MQDAVQLDAFRFHIDPASISFNHAILTGAQKEFDARTGRSGGGLLTGGLLSMVGPDRLGNRRGRGRGQGTSTGTRSSSTQRSTSRGSAPPTGHLHGPSSLNLDTSA